MRENNGLSVFNDARFGLFPSGFLTENFWDSFNYGGFKVDVKEIKDAYIFDAELPGIDKNDINIDINNNVLTIAVKVDKNNEEKDESGRYIRKERHMGSFKRSFSLENIKSDEIKAEMKNGVLTITCPKKEEVKLSTRKVEIQ